MGAQIITGEGGRSVRKIRIVEKHIRLLSEELVEVQYCRAPASYVTVWLGMCLGVRNICACSGSATCFHRPLFVLTSLTNCIVNAQYTNPNTRIEMLVNLLSCSILN